MRGVSWTETVEYKFYHYNDEGLLKFCGGLGNGTRQKFVVLAKKEKYTTEKYLRKKKKYTFDQGTLTILQTKDGDRFYYKKDEKNGKHEKPDFEKKKCMKAYEGDD